MVISHWAEDVAAVDAAQVESSGQASGCEGCWWKDGREQHYSAACHRCVRDCMRPENAVLALAVSVFASRDLKAFNLT